MAKVLLINNTESYHQGCKKVIDYYRKSFSSHDLVIPKTLKKIKITDFDIIVLNGEGSMHDDHIRPKIIKWLELLNYASSKGVKTAVVNTVWDNISKNTTELLKNITYVSVREILSKNEILKYIDKNIDINLDLSYFNEVKDISTDKRNIVAGNRYADKEKPKIINVGEDAKIDIFLDDWDKIVNVLKNSKMLVTGRHHEMYAACKANCPFVILEGNSHKNSGLIKTFDVNIPILPIDSTNEIILNAINSMAQYKSEFEKLFSIMRLQRPPNLLDKILNA